MFVLKMIKIYRSVHEIHVIQIKCLYVLQKEISEYE